MIGSQIGITTPGASWRSMTANVPYVRSFAVTAGLVLELRAFLRHSVANVPAVGAYLFEDDEGAPGQLIVAGVQAENAVLLNTTSQEGRWFSFPMGRWVPEAATVWAAVVVSTSGGTLQMAYESSGGADGSLSALGDPATFTDQSWDLSMHLVVTS